MTFHQEMRRLVLEHGAINNSYLHRFRSGDLTDQEIKEFATEFYNFVRFFPQILVTQLVNTENEQIADELTKVLYSELGGGEAGRRHELLYRDFLRSLGIDVHETMTRPMLPPPVPISRAWNSSTATAIIRKPWVRHSALKIWPSPCGII